MRNYRDCKAVALKEYYDYSPISTCTERSQYFLRNDSDCKDVDLYNARKRYAVIESLDLMRNNFWLASCSSKIKKLDLCGTRESYDFSYLSLSKILT